MKAMKESSPAGSGSGVEPVDDELEEARRGTLQILKESGGGDGVSSLEISTLE